MFCKIANINIGIENNTKKYIKQHIWNKFMLNNCNEHKACCISIEENIKNIHGISYTKLNESMHHFSQINSNIMLATEDWSKIKLIFNENKIEDFNIFLIQAFYTHAVQRHMIQLHSSLINYREKGILFLGPSGIGKTTQAELWNKYRDALIINGDMVFVQETEDCFLGWGTPWHGSSPYCENASVPIHAMIVLKQSPDNSIRELTGFEKVTTVSNSVFYPQWLENGMELCLETLDHLLTKVPVYELSCRPDEEAVTLTEQFIF